MPKIVALDANLLVLLIVGLAKPAYISVHKGLSGYSVEDFGLLVRTIESSASIVVTPNTLSEASNLLRQIKEPAKSQIGTVFRKFIERTKEIYIKSEEASSREEFLQIGLADSVLLEVAKGDIVVLSADLDLCVAAAVSGYAAVNFNHVRDEFYSARA